MRTTLHMALGWSLIAGPVVSRGQAADSAVVARIRAEEAAHSEAMRSLSWLSDVYGPRLTGGATIEQAAWWTERALRRWGITNVYRERWPFGPGWAIERCTAEMIAPQYQPLIAYPLAWSAGTHGRLTADVVHPDIRSEADFAKYDGTLRGKIVLPAPARRFRPLEGRVALRFGPAEREQLLTPNLRPVPLGEPLTAARARWASQLRAFYRRQGIAAYLSPGPPADSFPGGAGLPWFAQRVDGGTLMVPGGLPSSDTGPPQPPTVIVAPEQYNRMVRVLDKGVPVRVALDIATRAVDGKRPRGFNIIAEIPGSDPAVRDEVVLLGAHFDSQAAGTGATDDGTGVAALLEAMRLLRAAGARPRRTIRIALWGGAEQGSLGARAYVRRHFVSLDADRRPQPDAHLDAYFNLGGGVGPIRGLFLQGNAAAAAVFADIIAPVRDLGVDILSPRIVAVVDQWTFADAGLPSFEFLEEPNEYVSRARNTNMDVVDRVRETDLRQMATVVAVVAYLTAQRGEALPRRIPPRRDLR